MDKDQKQDADMRNQNRPQDNESKAPANQNKDQQDQQLHTEDLPDSSNESRGTTGSGQRQDSN